MFKLLSILSLIFCFQISNQANAQNTLDDYGYLIVPKKFSFQNENNEYNINQVVKTTLNKYQFKTFISGNFIPDGVSPCDILHLDITKSGFLSTKMQLIFTDCYGKEIYTSIEGQSRIKDFKPSYYEAIRNALKDVNIHDHRFNPDAKKIVKQVKKIDPAVVNTIPKNVKKLTLEFKDKQYNLASVNNHNEFKIYDNDKAIIGNLVKKENSNVYTLTAGSLNGTGTFDDFGNFILTRINPVNNTKITDTMARVK